MRKRLKKHWKTLLPALALAISVVAIYFYVLNPQKESAETFIVKRGILKEELTISGEIDASEKIALHFPTSGRLSWVGVKEGSYVEKYQAIAALDQRELQKVLQKRLNDYLSNRQDFDQAKDNVKDQVITDAIKRSLIKSQASLDNSVLDVEIQNLTKQLANLWTPIAGIVTRVDAPFAGVNITPQTTFEVVNPQTIYFEAAADQTEVTLIRLNQNGKLILDAFPNQTLKGTVSNISFIPKQTESGAVYKVEFSFPNKNPNLKLGMTGDLTFIINERQRVLYIPTNYIKTAGNKKYVITVIGAKKEKVYVTTGLETDNNIEVKSGLKAGDKIVSEK